MTTPKIQQNNTLANVRINTDIGLWKMLLQGIKKTHKLSRVEAFYDLIDRQCFSLIKGDNVYLNGTITEMAKAWCWDRETVTRFLDSLEQAGMLTIETEDNRKVFRLDCITVNNDGSGTP